MKVADGPKISGEIKELSAKIKSINLNTASNSVNSLIERGFSLIQSTIIPALNLFIKNNVELKFPSVMGITFTNVTLELKNKYFVVNYDITRDKTKQERPYNKIGKRIINCEEFCKNRPKIGICKICKSVK